MQGRNIDNANCIYNKSSKKETCNLSERCTHIEIWGAGQRCYQQAVARDNSWEIHGQDHRGETEGKLHWAESLVSQGMA